MKHVLTAPFLGTTLSACVATTPPIEKSRLREVPSGSTAYAEVRHLAMAPAGLAARGTARAP